MRRSSMLSALLLVAPLSAAVGCTATHCVYLPGIVQQVQAPPTPTVPPIPSPTVVSPPAPSPSVQPSWSPSPDPSAPTESTLFWSEVQPLPKGNTEAQGTVVNGKLYVFGGFDVDKGCCTPTSRAYVFDPAAGPQGTWTVIAPLPYIAKNGQTGGGMTHAPAATDGTNIYFAGGYIAQSPGRGQSFGTKQVWRYNVASNTYTRLPDLPIERAAGQLVYLSGSLHYIAGTNLARTQDVGDHYVLSLNGGTTWQTKAALPNPRQHAAAVALNGKIYYIGGQWKHDSNLVPQDDVHVYDPSTNAWTEVQSMPRPINHAASSTFVLNGRIIVAGGQIKHNTSGVANVVAYDPASDTWIEFSPMPRPRHSGVAGVINNTIYYATGNRTPTTFKGTVGSDRPGRSSATGALPFPLSLLFGEE